MHLIKDYTVTKSFCQGQYEGLIIPKGVELTHQTAMGEDPDYHFVDEFDWISEKYPKIAKILEMDSKSYGIRIPSELSSDDSLIFDTSEGEVIAKNVTTDLDGVNIVECVELSINGTKMLLEDYESIFMLTDEIVQSIVEIGIS